ncbi:hypothetical protein E1J38_006865 [Seonamhaeicola sediminis]|uniref:Beta-carotene 15,15'-monooxygenase n=1 Tax=Seonamhaeicola sediminis TaxID=2528206 RepID=A0A562YD24_9FLAO|nr:hypothetical protein [Seonamhaeicola sediminis]TWO32587.1 hypothetical protein E1J38_006865 [Seonamhaeicola sediminis]
MDGLDLLKKNWNKEQESDKLSAKDILPMLHKKSSSIVKLLFYISVGELFFWIIVNSIPYFTSDSYRERLNQVYSDNIMVVLSVFSYVVIILFIYLLYKSYKSISVTDNAKRLMKSIINTRKIIKYYVLYNLIMVGISMIIGLYYSFHNDPNAVIILEEMDGKGMMILIVVSTVITSILIVLIWLFYKLIYGLLLKRLNRNYKELKKLEI